MKVIKELRELNLEDNEIRVYLSCLKLGSSKVHEIAKKAELIRTTTYGLLRSLIEKGLVSTVLKNNITYFQAAPAKQLIEIIDEKRKKIQNILPELEKIQKSITSVHKIQLFEGEEGIKTVINDIVNKPNNIVKIIGSGQKWFNLSEAFVTIYYRKKVEMKVHTNVIVPDTKEERESLKNVEMKNTKMRFLKEVNFNGTCYIYQDKLAFVSYEEENVHGFIIQDAILFNLQNTMFDNLWKQAKP
jgi:HTH-type transcriptional regulator, sugar sensing transcriptional regulator